MTHEIGHLLGLSHCNITEATMYKDASIGETKKRSLDTDDKNGIATIY